MGAEQRSWRQVSRFAARGRPAFRTTSLRAATLLSILLSLTAGCGFGAGRDHDFGRGGHGCIQTTMCSELASWDPYRCECVANRRIDGGSANRDGGCVQTVLCTTWAHWDHLRCQCVVNSVDAAQSTVDAAAPPDGATADSTDGG